MGTKINSTRRTSSTTATVTTKDKPADLVATLWTGTGPLDPDVLAAVLRIGGDAMSASDAAQAAAETARAERDAAARAMGDAVAERDRSLATAARVVVLLVDVRKALKIGEIAAAWDRTSGRVSQVAAIGRAMVKANGAPGKTLVSPRDVATARSFERAYRAGTDVLKRVTADVKATPGTPDVASIVAAAIEDKRYANGRPAVAASTLIRRVRAVIADMADRDVTGDKADADALALAVADLVKRAATVTVKAPTVKAPKA